jgi:hypothetical protein
MSKKIAVFEVEFDTDMMIDDEDLQANHKGNWLEFMRSIFQEEGFGIFTENIKVVDVKEAK